MDKDATETVKAVGDCATISFYYLLQVGEYKAKRKETRQSKRCISSRKIQLFPRQDAKRHLHQLTINALEKDILSAYGSTLKLEYLRDIV